MNQIMENREDRMMAVSSLRCICRTVGSNDPLHVTVKFCFFLKSYLFMYCESSVRVSITVIVSVGLENLRMEPFFTDVNFHFHQTAGIKRLGAQHDDGHGYSIMAG